MILYRYVVDCLTINAHSSRLILLRNQNHWHDALTHTFPYVPLFHQFTNLPFVVPLSLQDCFDRLVSLEWKHRARNQFNVQFLEYEVNHVERHHQTLSKEKQLKLGKDVSSLLVFKYAFCTKV